MDYGYLYIICYIIRYPDINIYLKIIQLNIEFKSDYKHMQIKSILINFFFFTSLLNALINLF